MKSFKSFTELDVAMHNAKVAGIVPPVSGASGVGEDDESKLHDAIIAYCKQRRWYYSHSRMDRATTNQVGHTDFVIAADDGRTHWIEAKGPKTKVTREQEGTMHWLQSLGHNAEIVRSFPEFLAAIHREVETNPGRGTPQPKETET